MLGIEGESLPGLSIYPNPNNDLLTIETYKSDQHFIEITSLNGHLVYNECMDGTIHQIDLSSFNKGVYIITVRSRDFSTAKKLIKL